MFLGSIGKVVVRLGLGLGLGLGCSRGGISVFSGSIGKVVRNPVYDKGPIMRINYDAWVDVDVFVIRARVQG